MTPSELELLKAKAEAHVFRQIALAAMQVFHEISPDIARQLTERVRAELHAGAATIPVLLEGGAAALEHAEAVLNVLQQQFSGNK